MKKELVIGLVLVSLILVIGISGCPDKSLSNSSPEKESNYPAKKPGLENLTLVIGSGSGTEPVDIRVYLNDQLVVDDNFVSEKRTYEQGGNIVMTQPVYPKSYPLRVERGVYTIKAISEKRNTTLEEQIEITQEHWAYLTLLEPTSEITSTKKENCRESCEEIDGSVTCSGKCDEIVDTVTSPAKFILDVLNEQLFYL
jgi:hypothetical protein